MRPLIKLFGQLLAPAASRFLSALENPHIAQLSVQKQILSCLINSEYGQLLGIQSIADWQQIPIVDYADIEPWIERQKYTQAAILTAEPILFYEKTSGSCGPAKWIPYTKSLRRSFSHMFCIWAYDLIRHGPPFSTGKLYFCISPQLGGAATEEGLTVGLEDDSEYLDGWLRWFLHPFLVSPPGLNRLACPEKFKQKLCLALLEEEQLEILSIWSPTFLKVLLDYIQTHQTQLSEQLRHRISAERTQLILKSEIPWTQIWPELKLISCWDSVQAADQARLLRTRFPGVLVQGKGLLATEAPMTIPLISAQGCVPLLDEVFFEFEDLQGKIHLLHELETGVVYMLILSQKGGLYRYRIGDRVRVSHFYKSTPCLEFLGRTQATSDLVGEKLHEEFVCQVMESLPLKDTFFKSLVPATDPAEHYILLLDRLNLPPQILAQQLDTALCQSLQYRQARLLGQLSPARVLVSPHIPTMMIQYGMRLGKKWGDLKHPLLVTTPLDAELLALERYSTQLISS